ncbi:rubrerythrin family protein [Chlorobium sp. KB01]|uniref:rubrerythrin family protein n=1 Tax=Chlorobium sp. KB01 TaxID=1917528 RepID=UPI0009783A17|nr:rubrerythrin family protein [Chlorobium sp. KB01]
MPATLLQHLDESIKLELSLAKLYTLLHDQLSEDEDFWWQLAMEERGHASLLQQEKKQPQPMEFFPDNLLSKDLQSLIDTNEKISALIAAYSAVPPSRKAAFQAALDIELAAGESHFQHFLDSPTHSYSSNIFKQLNQEDRDHAERIRDYMKTNRIG